MVPTVCLKHFEHQRTVSVSVSVSGFLPIDNEMFELFFFQWNVWRILSTSS